MAIQSLNTVLQLIKEAGPTKTRVVPMEGQSVLNGRFRIQITDGTNWSDVLSDVPRSTAEDLVKQATNRIILG